MAIESATGAEIPEVESPQPKSPAKRCATSPILRQTKRPGTTDNRPQEAVVERPPASSSPGTGLPTGDLLPTYPSPSSPGVASFAQPSTSPSTATPRMARCMAQTSPSGQSTMVARGTLNGVPIVNSALGATRVSASRTAGLVTLATRAA